MWTIFSVGDSAFLEEVLNGVAMITGTTEFGAMVKVGLLLGVIILFLQSMWNGGRGVEIGQVFTAFIVFNVAFVPKVQVAIEDVYDDSVRVVANVPVGVAAAGSIISTVGYEVTRIFEQAFSTPAMTEYGFAAPLETLAGVRKMEVMSSDLMRSWVNYIKECTLIGVDLGKKDVEDIVKNEPFIDQLKFESTIYGTEIHVPTTKYYNCTDAYGVLEKQTEHSENTLYTNIAPHIGAKTLPEAKAKVEDALNQLGGAMAGSAQNWMFTTALMPAYNAAVEGKYVDDLAYTHALMANQAIAQRNTQWAAEGTLFKSIVRPLMTFLEGFTFAVTPIMAFVLAIAPIGGKMAGKYLLTLVWIAMWQPVMAITNLYLLMSASGKMQALDAKFAEATSYAGLQELNQEIQTWLATGGTLAAMTPGLSLMLVYGSAITATHLAGRLGGGDHVNEKIPSPDVAQPAPALAMGEGFKYTALAGMHRGEADQILGTANFNSGLSNAVSSAQGEMRQAQAAWGQTFSSALSSGYGKTNSHQALADFSKHVSSSSTQLSSATDDLMKNWEEKYGIQDQNKEAVRGIFAATLSGAAKIDAGTGALIDAAGNQLMSKKDVQKLILPDPNKPEHTRPEALDKANAAAKGKGGKSPINIGVGAELGLKGTAAHDREQSTSRSAEQLFSELASVKTSDAQQAQYQAQLAQSFQNKDSTAFTKSLSSTDEQRLSQTATESAAKTQQYQDVNQLQNTIGHQTSTSLKTLANQFANDSGRMHGLDDYINGHHDLRTAMNGVGGAGGTLAMAKEAGLVGDNARAAAALLALGQSGSADHLRALAGFMGREAPNVDPTGLAGVAAGAPESGSIRATAGASEKAGRKAAAQAGALGDRNLHDVGGNPASMSPDGILRSHFEAGQRGVAGFSGAATRAHETAAYRSRGDQLLKYSSENPEISNFMASVDQHTDLLGRVATTGTGAVGMTADNAKERYSEAYQEAMERPPEPSVLHWAGTYVDRARAAFDAAGAEEGGVFAKAEAGWEAFKASKEYLEANHNAGSRAMAATDALVMAASAVPGDFADNIETMWHENADRLHTDLYKEGRAMGLTEGQAHLYAASNMDFIASRLNNLTDSTAFSSSEMQQYEQMVRDEFKYFDDDGNIQTFYKGDEIAQKQIELVETAASGDLDFAGGALAELRGFNAATGRQNVKAITR